MKIKYCGETSPLELTKGRIYDVIAIEKGWYTQNRIQGYCIKRTHNQRCSKPIAFYYTQKRSGVN